MLSRNDEEISSQLCRAQKVKSSFGWSLSNLAAMLRQQLFISRDL
jgi:hypothetical protein